MAQLVTPISCSSPQSADVPKSSPRWNAETEEGGGEAIVWSKSLIGQSANFFVFVARWRRVPRNEKSRSIYSRVSFIGTKMVGCYRLRTVRQLTRRRPYLHWDSLTETLAPGGLLCARGRSRKAVRWPTGFSSFSPGRRFLFLGFPSTFHANVKSRRVK